MTDNKLMPVLYIPHGGGPLPLLGEPSHQALATFLSGIAAQLPAPKAILVVSAHWEMPIPSITAGAQPELIYDYYGFPEESYSIEYPAPGDPELAQQIQGMLQRAGFEPELADRRGFDHGLFVPLKLMYPAADIPCLQLSLLQGLNPAQHIQLGQAIAGLRQQGVLVLGSGMSFHNMQAFQNWGDASHRRDAEAFEQWLVETCCDNGLNAAQRQERLEHWERAPGAHYCHPREEHLIPLHVCFGAAAETAAKVVFQDQVLGQSVLGLLWE